MPLPRGFRYTHCKRGHAFDERNTYIRPDNGKRSCRACHRDRQWDYARRKREEADRREAPAR